ncbi:SDR family NAD(P)-dependent oxidoreductase [Solimonas marina]|uniref:SDR family oxidoreductase n=1 Tax=Solimonas marina TaxID=2714601 RepID=A0A969WC52_9GAMM|nr:SDR family NAD(P)-dependent oxidoreductase [Solimonas marina]NKF24222.1 SDR family oxidoreductase [Solimonas marina]
MNRIDLEGRVAVITGGARGIGYSTAERMLASGASVVLWDIDGERLEQAQASLAQPERVGINTVELTDEASVQAAAQATLQRFGKIDILVNNAGITGGNGPTWELDPAVWRRVLDVNLMGPVLTVRAIVPAMLKSGYGRIVNIASVAGKEGNPNASHYSASKAGVICLTKSLGKELATKNILVNCITPATANTEILSQLKPEHIEYMRSRIPIGRLGEPNETAAMICWLSSEDCSFTTASTFDISGGRCTY